MRRGGWPFPLGMFTTASLLEVAAWGHGQAFGPLFIERELGVAAADVPRWTGLLAAAPLMVAAPLAPFWGVLADRYSQKVVILRCYLVAAVAYLLAAVCQEAWQYFGTRLLLGLTFGSNAVMIAIVAGAVPQWRLGLAIGITQMVFPVGSAVGPLLGSGFIEWFGLRGMFVADAAIVAGSFALVLGLFREPQRDRDASLGILTRLRAVLGVVWQRPPLRFTFALFFLFAGGWTLVTPFVPVLITRVYPGENVAVVIGLILAAYGAVAGLAAPLAGRLADRLGALRLVSFNMAGMLVMSAGLILAATPEQVALAMLVGAVPFGGSNTTLYAYLARHTPAEHMSGIMSLSPVARNTAMLLTPLIGAAVAVFSLQAVFATAAVVFGLALLLSLALARLPIPAGEPLLAPEPGDG